MEEHGLVVQIKGKNAVIKTQRTSACDNCSSKKSCGTGGAGSDVLIELENSIGARVSDRVTFSVGSASILKAGLIVYLVPVLSFIAGVVIGQVVSGYIPDANPDLVSGLLGAAFLVAAFIGLKIYNAFLDRNSSFRAKILRVD